MPCSWMESASSRRDSAEKAWRGCNGEDRIRATGTRWTVSEDAVLSGAAGWPEAPIPASKALSPRPKMGFAMAQKLRANGGRGKGKIGVVHMHEDSCAGRASTYTSGGNFN